MHSKMLRNAGVGIAAATLIAWTAEGMAQQKSKISREAVTAMFNAARTSARTKWSIDGRCLWGYFFTDPDRQKLDRAGQGLKKDGYRFVEVRGPTKQRAGLRFILHVEKIERHSVDTLLARNDQRYAFARKHELDSYDGMDVGPLPGGKCDDTK